jgi:ATP-dependent Clp protease ATP-binding subunit ClpA
MMLSKNLEITLHKALNIAREHNHEYSTLEHLLLALTEDPDASLALKGCAVDIETLSYKLKGFLKNNLAALTTMKLTETKPTAGFQRVVHRAAINAHSNGAKEVNGSNILVEVFFENESYATFFLNEAGITKLDILNFIVKTDTRKSVKETKKDFNSVPIKEDKDTESKDDFTTEKEIKDKNSYLANYCINLNKLAKEKKIDHLIGRKDEIERTIEILCRRNKNNPLLIGEPGVGKTAIIEGLALRIVENDIPDVLKNATIYSLDLGALVAGTRYRGDFEERVKGIVTEIQKMPLAILFIDEIHTLLGAGSTSNSSLDAGNLLKPALARGNFRCIGSTTFKEYQTQFEKDRALARRFQKIIVSEPTIENTIEILKGLKGKYEEHHNVVYTNEAIEATVRLADRYIKFGHFPDKAIDIMDEAGARNKLVTSNKKKNVTIKDIESIIAKIMHIPAISVSLNDIQKLNNLEAQLNAVVFGQTKAVTEICTSLKLSRAGLKNHHKPIGCYLFAGSTGVGKTELAKQLSCYTDMDLKRFDMSEYSEQHSVSRLIGTPPGYVGFEQGGLLTDEIIKSAHSIVLFDEIEKAHPDIYNVLLQIMDYGQVTDNNGRKVNFCNTIIIMTTNAGAEFMHRASIGFNNSNHNKGVDMLNKVFSPEFRNRLDKIIYFEPLNEEVIKKIINKYLKDLKTRLADKAIKINVSSKAIDYLHSLVKDLTEGARNFAKLIDEKINYVLADHILFGKLTKGGVVNIGLKNNALNFSFSETETEEVL